MKKTLSFEKDLTFQTMIGEITTISFEEDLKFIDQSNIEGNFYISGKYKMTEASTLLEDFSYSIPIEIAMLENYDLETTKISIANFTYEIIDDDTLRSKIDVLVEGREQVSLEEENVVIEELSSTETEHNDKEKEITETELVRATDQVEPNDIERECDGEMKTEEDKEIPIKENKPLKQEEQTIQTQVINENIEEQTLKQQTIEAEIKQEIKREDEEKETMTQEKKTSEQEKQTTTSIKVNSLFSNLGDSSDTFTTYSVYIMREGDNLEKVMDKYKVKREDIEIYNDLSTVELNSKVIIPTSSDE